jgi:hypothetical protein
MPEPQYFMVDDWSPNAGPSFLRMGVILLLIGGYLLSPACADTDSRNTPLFMAHYMPWYQTPSVSGYWGWHWTMNHYNPDSTDPDGRRMIASHYYPVTGPYDSQDDLILEYQVLLMKLSGIDGVLVDWYGMEDFRDYAVLNESTLALFDMIRKAGLFFAVVYEDQTVQHMVTSGYLSRNETGDHGLKVMQYMQEHWFDTGSYLKLNDRPVLLTFGPQYYKTSTEWQTFFSALPVTPLFFTLDNRLSPAAAGAYPWPPMWKTNTNGQLTQNALNEYLNQFYQKASGWDYLIAGAFPGFHDIYADAGAGDSYGYLDPMNGATFQSTLQMALDHHPDVIQLVTWNDYGEGTVIEPTKEFGTRYLEIIQETRASLEPLFQYRREDLSLPLEIFRLRNEHAADPAVNASLDHVFDLMCSDQLEPAVALIDSLLDPTNAVKRPGGYSLFQNFPNPFNSSTTIRYALDGPMRVHIIILNTSGETIDTLIDEEQPSGAYSLIWNAASMPSGLYICAFKTGSQYKTRKLVLIR